MAELNFPANPQTGDTYDFGNVRYRYDGIKWTSIATNDKNIAQAVSVIRHISGAIGYVYCPFPMPSGATMTAIVSKQVPSSITVEVYKTVYPNRTLLGTITIAPNTGSATLTSGNPKSVLIGDVFEYVLTSATVADAFIGLRVVPV